MSGSSIETGPVVAAGPPAETESAVVGGTGGPGATGRDITARWQFWALVGGTALTAVAAGIVPTPDFDDGWSYQTLLDNRGRMYAGLLLASLGFVVLAAGLPLLRRYATTRGRAAVTVGLGIFTASAALFALAVATDTAMTMTANSDVGHAAGEALWDLSRGEDGWETAPYWIGAFLLSKIGWLAFVIGARRARTMTTPLLIVLLVVGIAWTVVPPGPALGILSLAMVALFAWMGRRVLDGPAPVMVATPDRSPATSALSGSRLPV